MATAQHSEMLGLTMPETITSKALNSDIWYTDNPFVDDAERQQRLDELLSRYAERKRQGDENRAYWQRMQARYEAMSRWSRFWFRHLEYSEQALADLATAESLLERWAREDWEQAQPSS